MPIRITSYRQAQAVTRGVRGKLQAHHILEARHLWAWGCGGEIADAPAVVLSRVEHQAITNALRQALPYGRIYAKGQVWQVYQRVYANYPEFLKAIERFFR
ncbi:hypothetical protein HYR99_31150 [Candidatus Poribacteria bacterium]|nr:hypothetical protein [Candidatus Poribacteria bacterium]